MKRYFEGPDVIITDHVFEVRRPYTCRFPIDELESVYVQVGSYDRVVVAGACTVVLGMALVAGNWSQLISPEQWLLAVMLLAMPAATTGACIRVRPRTWELRALHRAYDVRLFSSADARTFGQVRRALVRALEERRSMARS